MPEPEPVDTSPLELSVKDELDELRTKLAAEVTARGVSTAALAAAVADLAAQVFTVQLIDNNGNPLQTRHFGFDEKKNDGTVISHPLRIKLIAK